MKAKLTYFIIAAFIIFWVVLIGWGMIKTTFKLTREKSLVSGLASNKGQQETATKQTKTQEETTAPSPIQTEPSLRLVRAFKAKRTDFRDILPVMGTVKGKTEIGLKFEINGVIKTISFREGEKIKTGETIACLDQKDTQLKIAYAKNKFNAAVAASNSTQKKLEVHQKLYEAGAIIKSKLEEVALEAESAKFQAETARSEMELAENELNKICMSATKDGVMGPREAEEGEFVTPQDKVGSLLEISEVFIEVGVVERDIEKVKVGQRAKVYVDAYPNNAFEGTVKYIFPVIEGKSRTLTVKIDVPNPEGLLLPGMFCRAEISIVELKDALIVPITALTLTEKGTLLAPVIPASSIEKTEEEQETGIVQLRRVNIGYKTSDYAEITEGLSAEDLVIIEVQGEKALEDNVKVKILGIEEVAF
jgi:membrane fusion protein (multidrug efflux system)